MLLGGVVTLPSEFLPVGSPLVDTVEWGFNDAIGYRLEAAANWNELIFSYCV